ncbi:hypothetical protein TCDM_11043 [Trypanosoma cruzi Dm28c]|uniref:Uncharacterized protein n=1 Tax=Trypanosoma cruzi Dm28c TaxID=1416333 RepID=V5AL26_TRYCR|nr:hypothetical protein TCDM_11043 [Trypanosoma cruzi Dm28c]
MRAAGEAHRAVVMSVSVGVRVEQLDGNTRHPSQEECSNKQLKEGRVEKKTSIAIFLKAKRKRWGMREKNGRINNKKRLAKNLKQTEKN